MTALLSLAFVPGAASAADPGRWVETGFSSVPFEYFQGITSDPAGNLWFDGFYGRPLPHHSGTRRAGTRRDEIPVDVYRARATTTSATSAGTRRGRPPAAAAGVLSTPSVGNTCGTGSFGVADPTTLAVALLREARPGRHREGDVGRGLARRLADLDLGRQRPAGLPHLATSRRPTPRRRARAQPVRRLATPCRRAASPAPPSKGGRLLLAGQDAAPSRSGRSTDTGERRLELERDIVRRVGGTRLLRRARRRAALADRADRPLPGARRPTATARPRSCTSCPRTGRRTARP